MKISRILIGAMVIMATVSVSFAQAQPSETQQLLVKTLTDSGQFFFHSKLTEFKRPGMNFEALSEYSGIESFKLSNVKFDGCALSYESQWRKRTNVSATPLVISPGVQPEPLIITQEKEISIKLSDIDGIKIDSLPKEYPSSIGALILTSKNNKTAITEINVTAGRISAQGSALVILLKKESIASVKAAFEGAAGQCRK